MIDKTKRDFNDLIVDELLFLTKDEVMTKLKSIFPKKNISVTMSDDGNETVVVVDDVRCIITNKGYTI